MSLFFLIAVSVWLFVAIGPLWLLWRSRRGRVALVSGAGFMLLVLAAPFWDYFIMVPIVNKAYEEHAINKVYKVSDSRRIRVREWENEVQKPTTISIPYLDALKNGQLEFLEYSLEKKRSTELQLWRAYRMPISDELCQAERTALQSNSPLDKTHCFYFEAVDESQAEVIIDMGSVKHSVKVLHKLKRYQYSFWRATEAETGVKLAELVHGFIWDPELCYWANACRYVVDRDSSVVEQFRNVKSAVPRVSQGQVLKFTGIEL